MRSAIHPMACRCRRCAPRLPGSAVPPDLAALCAGALLAAVCAGAVAVGQAWPALAAAGGL